MSEPTKLSLTDRLRAPRVMSMFATREDLYRQLNDERAEAADLIDALVAALDRWEAAYQTGRHEPLVIAREAASAVLARTKGEPK